MLEGKEKSFRTHSSAVMRTGMACGAECNQVLLGIIAGMTPKPFVMNLQAAEEGFIAAQYLVGLAHLEGSGMEKNGRSAYYWLRMAEENSGELRQGTRALTEELKSKMRSEELQTLEHSVMSAVESNKRLTTRRPVEFIKRSTTSPSLRRSPK